MMFSFIKVIITLFCTGLKRRKETTLLQSYVVKLSHFSFFKMMAYIFFKIRRCNEKIALGIFGEGFFFRGFEKFAKKEHA